jgi:hypothetical protein
MSDKKSMAEELLETFREALPAMEANWQRLMDKGYQARLNDEPRMYHGRRQAGCFFRGWDAADADIKAGIATTSTTRATRKSE